jgi:rhamnogalacturonyl hydrolase YesR
LYDEEAHLFWRDVRYLNTNTFWSRGNGWVIAGTARVLEYLPETDTERAKYEQLFKDMAAALLPLQGEDGFWRSDLLNADAFPNPESSGTSFFVFGMAWGINRGLLDRETYLPVVLRGWTALASVAVNDAGRLGWVQQVGFAPDTATESDTHDYAAGALLLAGSEMLEL